MTSLVQSMLAYIALAIQRPKVSIKDTSLPTFKSRFALEETGYLNTMIKGYCQETELAKHRSELL